MSLFEEILNISKVEIKLRDNCAGEKETFHLPECSKESAAQGYPQRTQLYRPASGAPVLGAGGLPQIPQTRSLPVEQLRVASLSSPFCTRRPRSQALTLLSSSVSPASQTQPKSTRRP